MNLKEIEIIKCPFCNKGDIQLIHFPSATRVKIKKTATFGSKMQKTRTSDTWIVSSNCSVCGKNSQEIEKKLKEEGIIG
ncbi:MAG: hypothetical protein QXI58_02375 [Candidatus Micrarchaeia archaeon]